MTKRSPAPRGAWLRGAVPFALALVALAPSARAQSANANEARDAFKAGMSLEQAGDWEGALKKFRDAGAFKSTPQIRFQIARCLEKLGNWTEAIGAYELAMAEATGAQRKEITKTAKPAVEALRKKVPKLVIERAPGVEFATVYLDDAEVMVASFGQPLALNPGGHVIKVIEGGVTGEQKVTLAEGETKTVVARAPERPPPPPPPPVAKAPPPPPPPESEATWLPWTLMGVGAASLTAGGVFLILRRQKLNDINDECGPAGQPCPNSMRSVYDDGRRFNLLANITGGVGAAALGAGVVLLLTQSSVPDSNQTRNVPPIEAMVSPGFVGVRGRF